MKICSLLARNLRNPCSRQCSFRHSLLVRSNCKELSQVSAKQEQRGALPQQSPPGYRRDDNTYILTFHIRILLPVN